MKMAKEIMESVFGVNVFYKKTRNCKQKAGFVRNLLTGIDFWVQWLKPGKHQAQGFLVRALKGASRVFA
ncbi:MAG: hypothetical protein KKE17_03750 [Proteobacteria bacterium]|nr:hypothetical protein [Pseudomonadota bacterium]MBU1709099.1 hypothetical protein [Pseudomonadota bacterium]